jgi:hypothetical protein
MTTLKAYLQQLIAQGETEDCLNNFSSWAETNDVKVFSTLILLRGQFAALQRDKTIGILSGSDYSIGIAKLNYGLMELIKKIPDNIPAPNNQNNPSDIPPPPVVQNNTILFLAANPNDAPQLNLNKEFVQIFLNVQNSKLEVRTQPATTSASLRDALLDYQPRFIHFSGHGTSANATQDAKIDITQNKIENLQDDARAIGKIPTDDTNLAGIYLLDTNGAKKFVSGAALANLFKICLQKFKIDLVILNACYSEEQAKAIFDAGIPYVIGMNTAIPDATAIEFSTGFYRSLAKDNDISFAFDWAKGGILLEGLRGDAIPVLYKK